MNASLNNAAANQLFDMKQRADGAWVVWTRKSPADLGMVNRASIEDTRAAPFTNEEWAEFIRQPHFTDPTVWVAAGVYDQKPPVQAVLTLLGVKAKTRIAKPPRNATKSAPVEVMAA